MVTLAISMPRATGLLGFALLEGFWLMDSERPSRYPRALLGLPGWCVLVDRVGAGLLRVGRAGFNSRVFGGVAIGCLSPDVIFGIFNVGGHTLQQVLATDRGQMHTILQQ